jgi:ribosomal protein L12E/L44/L45/RPP1/RPP2
MSAGGPTPTMEGGMAMVGMMKAYVDSALEQMERRLARRVDDMEGRLNARLDALLAAVSNCSPHVAAAAAATTTNPAGDGEQQTHQQQLTAGDDQREEEGRRK